VLDEIVDVDEIGPSGLTKGVDNRRALRIDENKLQLAQDE